LTGIGTGLLILIFSIQLKQVFQTQSTWMFIVFGTGIPVYFLMSVNRGIYQGKNALSYLSKTYIFEMAGRLVATVPFLVFFPMIPSTLVVAAGITISFIFGLQPFQKEMFRPLAGITASFDSSVMIKFFALTAFYELTQIIINNSDIILVKHYFNNTEAGLYSSLALIGRMVYFVAWMFVMLLLPKVIQLKNEGKDTQLILFKYVSYILLLSATIVFVTYFFPQFVIGVMFGEKYLGIAFLLWKYALATSIFALSNIFAYYFLSINSYFPVVISAFFGLVQIVLIVLYHKTLEQVVEMQILSMTILLFFQLVYFLLQKKIKFVKG
jgi:O-antigen/teichoic acid export membrane protein